MRSELEELLKKPDDKKPEDQQKQQQDQNQKQDQNSSRTRSSSRTKSSSKEQDQQQNPGGPQNQGGQKRDQQQQQRAPIAAGAKEKPEEANPGKQSAFGDMGRPLDAARTHGSPERDAEGGRREEGRTDDPARDNPELAVPLEKLEQVKNQDSPAELFEMLRKGEPTPPPVNTGKNW